MIIEERGLSSQSGGLVDLSQIPDQEGDVCVGLWLDFSERFWRFTVLVDRESSRACVETFEEVTKEISVGERLPGVQASFGRVAIDTLREHLR